MVHQRSPEVVKPLSVASARPVCEVAAPAVKVELSFEGRSILNHDGEGETEQPVKKKSADTSEIGGKKSLSGRTLSEDEVRIIQELK